jgi:hypothetical protein
MKLKEKKKKNKTGRFRDASIDYGFSIFIFFRNFLCLNWFVSRNRKKAAIIGRWLWTSFLYLSKLYLSNLKNMVETMCLVMPVYLLPNTFVVFILVFFVRGEIAKVKFICWIASSVNMRKQLYEIFVQKFEIFFLKFNCISVLKVMVGAFARWEKRSFSM